MRKVRRVMGEIVNDDGADVAYLRGSLVFEPVQAHPGAAALACEYGSGGDRIATAGGDMRVQLWEAHTGNPLATFHAAAPCISLAVRGRHLVCGNLDGTVYVLAMEEAELAEGKQ